MSNERSRARFFAAGLALPVALALLPPIFEPLLALSPLAPGEPAPLWALGVGLLLGAGAVALRGGPRSSALLMSLTLILGAEIGARAWVGLSFGPDQRTGLDTMLSTWRGESSQYTHHPFLHYVGNPDHKILQQHGGEPAPGQAPEPSWMSVYNRFGFQGRELGYVSPQGVQRVACLGGSTTETGYPAMLEDWLNAHAPRGARYEALNFGLGGWTSAHSLVNYTLNVVDFEPSVVVIHHAWNEHIALNMGCRLRGDYAHLLTQPVQAQAASVERLPGVSVIYRLLRHRNTEHGPPAGGPPDMVLGSAWPPQGCEQIDYLWPFRRNLETLVLLARARDQRVVLTTMPHASQVGGGGGLGEHFTAANAMIRDVHASLDDPDVLLVDLAAQLPSDAAGWFMDQAHMSDRGRAWKAELIGQALLGQPAAGR
jgi:hypothetical protein